MWDDQFKALRAAGCKCGLAWSVGDERPKPIGGCSLVGPDDTHPTECLYVDVLAKVPAPTILEEKPVVQDTTKTPNGYSLDGFPFKLEDLVSWTVKRTDGTVTKFVLTEAERDEIAKKNRTTAVVNKVYEKYAGAAQQTTHSLSAYCNHTPKTPIFEAEEDRNLRLYVGDSYGAKQTRDDFDFIIDGGDVITLKGDPAILTGDSELRRLLREFTVEIPQTRVLKIDWFDRRAPDVVPEFWTELNKLVSGDVMTCCQGGHGRSGSAFVCLLLNNAPDYDVLDAVIHLRAVHCVRAIESKVQHDYLNDVGKFLGRDANAHEAEKIDNYKEAFRKSTKPTAVRMKKILGWS